MRLSQEEARTRLAGQDHGILCTLHAQRGVDAVPVVFAVDDLGFVGVPLDRVKPKASTHLQRERNLAADPRATLLVEHWNPTDWAALWWVRAAVAARRLVRARVNPGRAAVTALPAVPRPALRARARAADRRHHRLGWCPPLTDAAGARLGPGAKVSSTRSA